MYYVKIQSIYHKIHKRLKNDKFRKGPSTTKNVIKLLETMNFDKSIIYDANYFYNKIIEESN